MVSSNAIIFFDRNEFLLAWIKSVDAVPILYCDSASLVIGFVIVIYFIHSTFYLYIQIQRFHHDRLF